MHSCRLLLYDSWDKVGKLCTITHLYKRINPFINGYKRLIITIMFHHQKCLNCGEKITGHIDKKYCNDQCRTQFNNRNRSSHEKSIQQVNAQLRMNRTILKSLCPVGKASYKKWVFHSVIFRLFMEKQEIAISFAMTMVLGLLLKSQWSKKYSLYNNNLIWENLTLGNFSPRRVSIPPLFLEYQ